LTDAELRANPVPISATALNNLDADVGAPTDTPAGADGTGNYAIIPALKRALLNGASLLARIPATLGQKTGANSFPVVLASDQGIASETTLASVLAGFKAEDSTHVSGDLGIAALAIRQSTDGVTTNNDGDYTNLKCDEEGRLKVASKPASYADITGDITTTQPVISTPVVGGTVAGDVSRASNVMMFCTGTFVGINCTFEASLEATGDANWFGIQAIRTNANTIETTTGVLGAQPAYAWELSVNGVKRVSVRATARTSGTQSWRFVLGTYATEPIPGAQVTATQAVSLAALPALVTGTANIGQVGLILPTPIADVASAAITSTATTAAFTPTYGASYKVQIPVTAVTGTTPTMDVRIEESLDGGTNWFTVYDFPRITATGNYSSPKLPLTGNRVRYVQTISGTTPSFTRAINRIQTNDPIPALRQLIDRAISLTTLNAATAALDAAECNNAQVILELGTASTPPAIQIEGSDSLGGAAQWYAIGSPITGVASSTVQVTVPNVQSNRIRARVSTAGATIGAGYVLTLKGF
jgi:hypothetical protein